VAHEGQELVGQRLQPNSPPTTEAAVQMLA
jgi:hypothetical protein